MEKKTIELVLLNGTKKMFSQSDVRRITSWDDAKDDEPEKYLYLLNFNNTVSLPFFYYKSSQVPSVPVSTRLTIESFLY